LLAVTYAGSPHPWQYDAASSVEENRMVMLHAPPHVMQVGSDGLKRVGL
jgi:hypothetical protein